MPKFCEFARSAFGIATGAICLYQTEVANAQENTFELDNSENTVVSTLGKVAKLFSTGKDAADTLEIRDAKLAGRASKEQMDRGVNAISNFGSDASSAVAISSGGRLYSVTNAAVAPVLTSIAQSEGSMLNRLTKAQQEFEQAVLRGNSYDIAMTGENLERARIEASQFRPDTGDFWSSAKSMVSVVGTKVESASIAFLKDSIVGISELASPLLGDGSTLTDETLPTDTVECGTMDHYSQIGGSGCGTEEEPQQATEDENFNGTWQVASQVGLLLQVTENNFSLRLGAGMESCGTITGTFSLKTADDIAGSFAGRCADLNMQGSVGMQRSGGDYTLANCVSMATGRPNSCSLGYFATAERVE